MLFIRECFFISAIADLVLFNTKLYYLVTSKRTSKNCNIFSCFIINGFLSNCTHELNKKVESKRMILWAAHAVAEAAW